MNIVLRYLLLINLGTFIIRGVDKYRAIKGRRRISEKHLLHLSFFGGFFGALAGMSLWRHKTIKGSFLWKFWAIGLVWVVLLFVLLFNQQ